MTHGRNLRRIRQEKGWTQWQLSRAVGVSPGRILLIERGDIPLTPELLTAIAKVLGVSEDTLRR